ncbi:hypothetical protein HK405_009677 [Cladochytrium tenue]|nr:hypothetical protein HK405_009677 [Cladochytrium tenue]
MVLGWSHCAFLDHPWATVTQALWQKYPNPFSSHVLSSDVLERYVDASGRLHTVRLFVKEGRLPRWGRAMLAVPQAMVVEVSVVDPAARSMTSVQRNLSHARLLLVEERQAVRPATATEAAGMTAAGWSVVRFANGEPAPMPAAAGGAADEGTVVVTEARIVSGAAWAGLRTRIEGFGLSRLKTNTVRSFKGLLHVIERVAGGLRHE